MNYAPPFGEWLRHRRQALDLSRKDLAARTGCSVSLIEKLELGQRKPSRQIAELLAECLEIAPVDRKAFLEFARPRLATHDIPEVRLFPGENDAHSRKTNLPSALTRLIGRDDTVAALRELLLSADKRLLTITGPPGVGKTRTALQVAASLLDEFEAGVFLVPLATIRDPDLVLFAIAQVLELAESGSRPVLAALTEHLANRNMLLVLDNFEQVVGAGPQVSALASACPALKVLVTSREPLHVRGEQQFALGALQLPDPHTRAGVEVLKSYPAIALFVERAKEVRPGFALTEENAAAVAAICTRLDGLPLAIELLAARCKLFAPEQVLSMLDSHRMLFTQGPRDLPARQQTLQYAIDSSYELLAPSEQTLFRQQSVFAGGCSLAAVQAVCFALSDEPVDALDTAMSLVDKSLLQFEERSGELRLTMLETIRQYAMHLLESSSEAAATRRYHAEYYLALAETANPQLSGSEQGLWLARLESDHDNLRAALDWALDNRETGLAARLATALAFFWDFRGYLTEGSKWLGRVLEQADALPPELKARVLLDAGSLAHAQADLERAEALVTESWRLQEHLGEKHDGARSLSILGLVAMDRGDFGMAVSYFEEGVRLQRELNDSHGVANVLSNLALAEVYRENFQKANDAFGECLTIYRQLADQRGIATTLANMGEAARMQGDYQQARAFFAEALGLAWRLDAKHIMLACLGGLATIETAQGHSHFAAWLYGVEEALRDAVGAPLAPVDQAEYERCVAQTRSQMDDQAFAEAWQEGRSATLEQAIHEITL